MTGHVISMNLLKNVRTKLHVYFECVKAGKCIWLNYWAVCFQEKSWLRVGVADVSPVKSLFWWCWIKWRSVFMWRIVTCGVLQVVLLFCLSDEQLVWTFTESRIKLLCLVRLSGWMDGWVTVWCPETLTSWRASSSPARRSDVTRDCEPSIRSSVCPSAADTGHTTTRTGQMHPDTVRIFWLLTVCIQCRSDCCVCFFFFSSRNIKHLIVCNNDHFSCKSKACALFILHELQSHAWCSRKQRSQMTRGEWGEKTNCGGFVAQWSVWQMCYFAECIVNTAALCTYGKVFIYLIAHWPVDTVWFDSKMCALDMWVGIKMCVGVRKCMCKHVNQIDVGIWYYLNDLFPLLKR